MLENLLEEVRTIRQILERKEADRVTAVITQPNVPIQPTQVPVQPTQGVNQAPAQVVVQQVPVAQGTVPTTSQVESFTREQIALAMSNAQAMGKQALINKIFTTFRVQTLMEIDPSYFNQIAVMLREEGVQVQ